MGNGARRFRSRSISGIYLCLCPAEIDMQRYFRESPPSVHQVVLTLEREGFIWRQPGIARSIQNAPLVQNVGFTLTCDRTRPKDDVVLVECGAFAGVGHNFCTGTLRIACPSPHRSSFDRDCNCLMAVNALWSVLRNDVGFAFVQLRT
jgi:hypothetical protein